MENLNTFKKNITLLIVDDEADWIGAVTLLLEPYVGKILSANNGKQALEILADSDVALVLTDTNMPIMNGIEFLKGALLLKPLLKVVVLFEGLNGSSLNREDILKLGAEDVMKKREFIDLVVNQKLVEYLDVTLE